MSKRSSTLAILLLVFLGPVVLCSADEVPQWIWGDQASEEGKVFLEGRFVLDEIPVSGTLRITADDFFVLNVNGKFLMFSENWRNLRKIDLTDLLKKGENRVTARCSNEQGPAGLLAWITLKMKDGRTRTIVSNDKWKTRAGGDSYQEDPLVAAKVLGPRGMQPWGSPWDSDSSAVNVAEGFKVEKLYDVPANEGSWVSICNDGHGGLYASDEKEQGLFHISLPKANPSTGREVSSATVIVTRVPIELSGAQGMLVEGGVLYAQISGVGLHQMNDTDGDGRVDETKLLLPMDGHGEHGIHGLMRDPNGGGFFLIAGNGTDLPDVIRRRNPAALEDKLFDRIWAPKMLNRKGWVVPGGWVGRYDIETNKITLVSMGLRNAYDLAANEFGDRFTYDSDEEWDLGMPWYRATRIYHTVSGGEYGWRSGSDKWPAYYEDVLPPLLEIGPGSPTGMLSGRGAKFPARYQRAIFALDWTYGTMRAISMTPDGASYQAEVQEFLSGTPLALTDAVIAADGSMIFVTGGRKIPSAIYRVTYVGKESTEPIGDVTMLNANGARQRREQLEDFHGRLDGEAIDRAWSQLASPDRFLRFAARVAVESQPIDQWISRLEEASNPQTIITGVVALARMGDSQHAETAQSILDPLDLTSLNDPQLLGFLRAQALVWSRLGKSPDSTIAGDRLLPLCASDNPLVQREVTRLMVSLNDTRILEPAFAWIAEPRPPALPEWGGSELLSRNESKSYGGTFARYLSNPPPLDSIQLATFLADLSDSWTETQARQFFQFLIDASRRQGGAAYLDYLGTIRQRALGSSNEALAEIARELPLTMTNIRPITVTPPEGPGQKWTVETALAAFALMEGGEVDLERGRNLFHATSCINCHQFDGEGGAIGPDLSNARGKFDTKAMLQSILEPSNAISDLFGTSMVLLESGKILTGIVVRGDDDTISIFEGEKRSTVDQEEILQIKKSPVSMMPADLVNTLSAEELHCLIQYILGR